MVLMRNCPTLYPVNRTMNCSLFDIIALPGIVCQVPGGFIFHCHEIIPVIQSGSISKSESIYFRECNNNPTSS